ncbi:MAG: lytic transglycosylase domain-containing protein [Desulfobacteraceae bacterium]|nr:MAG: lytic transglycosylase domain-containing protein [Desulfobacteraceae bacterium]
MLAMLTVPSALCSQQHRVPAYPVSSKIIFGKVQIQQPSLAEVLQEPRSTEFTAGIQELPANDGNMLLQDDPPYYDHIMQAAQSYDVDPALIRAIIVAESGFNPQAVSKRGAQGLMQLMPTTAKSLGVIDSFDPALNIDGGVRYFRRLLDRFEGDVSLALAAYNAGSRYVRQYGGVPPFRATHHYIKKVLHYQKKFQSEMAVGVTLEPAV